MQAPQINSVESDIDPDRMQMFADRLLRWEDERVRIEYDDLFQLFEDVFPPRPRGIEQREWLLTALRYAESKRIIDLPSPSGRSWDRRLIPAIPHFVKRILVPKPPPPKPWKNFLWHSRLSWVRHLNTLSESDYEFLRQVHEGLKNQRFTQIAPLKYRSFELTKDEKRLGVLQKGALFYSGRLTLDLLGCAPEYPQLAWEYISDKPNILIFENAAPPKVAKQVLLALPDPPYGMVGYGCGGVFAQSVRYLADIERPVKIKLKVKQIHYVGDIDRPGLNIARCACDSAQQAQLPPVTPAPGIHALMLESVRKFDHPLGTPHEKHKIQEHGKLANTDGIGPQ